MAAALASIAIGACCASVSASAQGLNCASFLRERDGSWRSFDRGTMVTPRGPVPVKIGERFRRSDGGAKTEAARMLDALCQPK